MRGSVKGKELALSREVNLDTLSSDRSEEEIRDSWRSFQCLSFMYAQKSVSV